MGGMPQGLMSLLSGGGGASAAPTPPQAPQSGMPGSAPAGGPMTTPQPKAGLTQAAMVNVSMVIKLLEQSISAFGATTEEGKTILDCLQKLSRQFGEQRQKSDQLIPAELMQLIQAIPGAGGGSPVQKAMGGMPPGASAMPPAGMPA